MKISIPSVVLEGLHQRGYVEWNGMTFTVGEDFILTQSHTMREDDIKHVSYQKTYLGKLETHWRRGLSTDEKKLFCDALDQLENYFKENDIAELNVVGVKLGLMVALPVVKWETIKDFLDLAASRKFVDKPWDGIPLKLVALLKLRKKERAFTDWRKQYEYTQCALDHYFNRREIERLKPKKSLNLFVINDFIR